jgi:hypothetical protein
MRQLESSFNSNASIMLQNIKQSSKIMLEQGFVAVFRGIVIVEETSTYDEAWNHEDSKLENNVKMPTIF